MCGWGHPKGTIITKIKNFFIGLTLKKDYVYIDPLSTPCRQRPYHVEHTGSRPITEVKQRRAGLVLGWVTAWEHLVLLANFFFFFFFFSILFSQIKFSFSVVVFLEVINFFCIVTFIWWIWLELLSIIFKCAEVRTWPISGHVFWFPFSLAFQWRNISLAFQLFWRFYFVDCSPNACTARYSNKAI